MTNGRKSWRVAVVEDEFLIAVEVEEMLAELGHVVVGTAGTLKAALALCRKKDFDCALLDLNLGGTLSYPVADLLMKRDIPFIFATAYPPVAIDDAYHRVPQLQKPLDAKTLQSTLADVLGCRNPAD